MRPARLLVVTLGALLLASPRGATAAPPPATPRTPRTLAIVPFYAPERMWQLYAPFVEHLTRATGERWQLVLPTNHEELIDDVCTGKVDVAFLGPVPLARANKRCGAAPFLAVLGPDGSPDFHAVLVTADPAVGSVANLASKEIGFFKGSTAAHVIPMKMLALGGLPAGTYRPVFVESQDRLMSMVLSRKVSAAGVKSALFKRFEHEEGLRALAISEPLPSFSFVALPSFGRATRTRLESVLLGLQPRNRKADAEVVKGWDDELRNGFVRPAPDFLPAVLGLLELTESVLRDAR